MPQTSFIPANIEVEREVLASILLEPECLVQVLSMLALEAGVQRQAQRRRSEPEICASRFRNMAQTVFVDPRHSSIYEAILSLSNKQIGIDVLTVSDWLQKHHRLDGIGGQAFLLEVQSSVASSANIEAWCKILRDLAMLREMLKVCKASQGICIEKQKDGVDAILDEIESGIFNVRSQFVREEIQPVTSVMRKSFQHLNDVINKKIEPGIMTGFPDMDTLTGGLKPGELFIIAARPSIGKTALALNIVRNIALRQGDKRRSIMLFSLEMGAEQIGQRLLCTEAGIPLTSIIDGSFNRSEITKLTKAAETLSGAKLFIDPTGGISIFELGAKARKYKALHGIDLIVVDYLQLMKAGDGEKESRQVEVAAISGGLKKIAKELQVPVLVLAQLNRDIDKGSAAAKPKLSHLRESGAIEQDADLVVFLHRDRDASKEGRGASSESCEASLIVEKNRNGQTGECKILFMKSLMEFRSISHRYGKEDIPQSIVNGKQ